MINIFIAPSITINSLACSQFPPNIARLVNCKESRSDGNIIGKAKIDRIPILLFVFDAIALNNPYAAHFLSEEAWNQLVLKAIFMGRPLYKIYDLLERKNQKLALVLNDYIQERWSASRAVSPEVWQLMSGYNHPELQKTLKKAVASTNVLERRAAETVLQGTNTLENKIVWVEIGKQFNN